MAKAQISMDSVKVLLNDGYYDEAEEMLHKKLNEILSEERSDSSQSKLCEIYFYLGMTHHQLDQFDTAISFYEKSSFLCKELASQNYLYYSYVNTSRCYVYKMEFDSAIIYLDSLLLQLDTNNYGDIAQYYVSIAWLFQNARITDYAVESYIHAAEYFHRDSQYYMELVSYYDAALCYDDADLHEKTLLALEICDSINGNVEDAQYDWIVTSCRAIKEVTLGQYEKSLSTFEEAFKYGDEVGAGLCGGNSVFYALALIKNNSYEDIDSILEMAEAGINSSDNSRDRRNIYEGLYLCYEALGRDSVALGYYKQYIAEKDLVDQEDYRLGLAYLESKEEFRSLKSTLHFLQSDLHSAHSNLRISRWLLLFLVVLFALAVMLLYRWNKYRSMYRFNQLKWDIYQKKREKIVGNEQIVVINKLENFLKDNISDSRITNQRIRQEIKTPVREINKILKDEFGITLREFIHRIKIEESKKLLLSSGLTISEIAYSLGYSDLAYFSKTFKRMTNQSPSQWKNNAGSD